MRYSTPYVPCQRPPEEVGAQPPALLEHLLLRHPAGQRQIHIPLIGVERALAAGAVGALGPGGAGAELQN